MTFTTAYPWPTQPGCCTAARKTA